MLVGVVGSAGGFGPERRRVWLSLVARETSSVLVPLVEPCNFWTVATSG